MCLLRSAVYTVYMHFGTRYTIRLELFGRHFAQLYELLRLY